MNVWRAISGFFVLFALAMPAAGTDFYGMLPMRDLSPFGFLRLDMRPSHAVLSEPRRWTLETEFATQNTWAMSPEVESYLTALEASGRRPPGRNGAGSNTRVARRELPG
jgi:hypothetical protein